MNDARNEGIYMNKSMNTRRLSLGLLFGAALCVGVSGCANRGKTSADTNSQKENIAISVSVATPAIKSVQGVLTLNGIVRTENELNVVAETAGKVVRVFAETGKRVAKGDILAQIDDEVKLASYKTAQASYDKSKSDWEKAKDLFEQKVISDSDLQGAKLAYAGSESQLLMARRDYENAKVRAPIGGVITQKFATIGSMLSPGAPVAHLVDSDNLKMTVQVGERDVLKIRQNMAVEIASDLYPGVSFAGRVSAVSPKGDSALTFPVEIALKSDARKPLYDGMSAKARISLGARSILAIPRVALVGSREDPKVYVVADGVAKLASVVTGGEYGTDIEILKGLGEAERVVVAGQNNLSDGASVAVIEDAAK